MKDFDEYVEKIKTELLLKTDLDETELNLKTIITSFFIRVFSMCLIVLLLSHFVSVNYVSFENSILVNIDIIILIVCFIFFLNKTSYDLEILNRMKMLNEEAEVLKAKIQSDIDQNIYDQHYAFSKKIITPSKDDWYHGKNITIKDFKLKKPE